jgi:hypothetical protein
MLKRPPRARKSERGQSFTELAISIVFLLVLLSVVIDLGWAFYQMIALRDTAQEAASFGIMCPDANPVVAENKIRQRLRLSATAPLDMKHIDDGNVVLKFFDAKGEDFSGRLPKHGDMVSISVEIQHQIIVPFAATFIGRDTYPLKVQVTDTIMVDTCQKP